MATLHRKEAESVITQVKLKVLIALLYGLFPCWLTAQKGKQEKVVYSREIYFDFARYEIRKDQERTLQVFLRAISKNPGQIISVTGHTDDVDNVPFNLKLGLQRAQAVKDYLAKKGVNEDLIKIATRGKSQLKVKSNSDSARALNRRVTLELLQGGPGGGSTPVRVFSNVLFVFKDSLTGKLLKSNFGIKNVTITADSLYLAMFDTNEVSVPMTPYVRYRVQVNADGYKARELFYQTEKVIPARIEILLSRYEISEKLDFDKIYFKPDTDEFQPTAHTQLIDLLQYLQHNANIKVDIVGHINYPLYRTPMTDWQQFFFYDLSVRRANAVVNYLIRKGIAPERLSYRGLSNKKMIYPMAVGMEQFLRNMRVEVLVLK